MNTVKRVIGASLLGGAVIGATAIGGGVAGAAPAPAPHPGQSQQWHDPGRDNGRWHPVRYRTPGENPQWRPGPVFRDGRHYQPVWDAARHHWGFWLGPIWIPIG